MATLITFNTKDVQQTIGSIPRKILVPATVRALNKVAANVKTAAGRAIRERRGLPAAAVNKTMVIQRANRQKLRSTLVVRGKPIGLKDYKARQVRKGVTVEVTRGARKLIPSAFIVHKLSGQVFTREGKGRLPIEKMVGPSIPSTFLQERVKLAWLTVAKDAMVKRNAEELRYELSKLRKKA
jgi:hypothetical protein